MFKQEHVLKLVIGLVAALTLLGGILVGLHGVHANPGPIHLRALVCDTYLPCS